MENKRPVNRLISLLYRYGQRFFMERLEEHGCRLKMGQMPSLLLVWRSPGITQDGICRSTGMDKGTTARAVKSLEEEGLILRTADPRDHRANRLTLTPEGEALIPVLLGVTQEYHQWLFRGFTPREQEQAAILLRRLAENAFGQPLPEEAGRENPGSTL